MTSLRVHTSEDYDKLYHDIDVTLLNGIIALFSIFLILMFLCTCVRMFIEENQELREPFSSPRKLFTILCVLITCICMLIITIQVKNFKT